MLVHSCFVALSVLCVCFCSVFRMVFVYVSVFLILNTDKRPEVDTLCVKLDFDVYCLLYSCSYRFYVFGIELYSNKYTYII